MDVVFVTQRGLKSPSGWDKPDWRPSIHNSCTTHTVCQPAVHCTHTLSTQEDGSINRYTQRSHVWVLWAQAVNCENVVWDIEVQQLLTMCQERDSNSHSYHSWANIPANIIHLDALCINFFLTHFVGIYRFCGFAPIMFPLNNVWLYDRYLPMQGLSTF